MKEEKGAVVMVVIRAMRDVMHGKELINSATSHVTPGVCPSPSTATSFSYIYIYIF